MVAEAASCSLWVPIDVIKERMQVAADAPWLAGRYTTLGSAVRDVWVHGGLRTLYKGYGATLASFGPFSGLYFMLYESSKATLMSMLPDAAAIPVASIAAGVGASVLTNPLDAAKLRLQVARAQAGPAGSAPGYFRILADMARHEGMAGLMAGAGARAAFHVPMTAISFSTFEACKSLAAQHL